MTRIEVLNRIQEIYHRLDNESLEPHEIDELVDLSNNLYERALILRYKVAEQKIFGENDDLNTAQIAEKAEEVSTEMPKEVIPQPTIDFSIFEEKVEEKIEEKIAEPVAFEPIKEEVKPEPEMIFQPEPIQSVELEPVVELKKEEIQEVSPEIIIPVEQAEPISATTNHDKWSHYFERVLAMHSSGLQTTLPSLSGSFGLNERILYINELFNGEAENFSNAVIELDHISDWNSCKVVLGKMGNEQGWDQESETVGEFILHVKRKYA